MTFNKSQIMHRAWEIYHTVFARTQTKAAFRMALQNAWSEAKYAASMAALRSRENEAQRETRENLYILDCKTRWSRADYACSDELRRAA